jgi:CubicO group peptidase (beta-lactamase class C family)
MISTLFCLLAFVQTPAPAAQAPVASAPKAPRDFSDMLAGLVKKHDVPGLVVLALKGHDIVGKGVSGVRKRGAEELLTFEDKFHLGSCTKAMTATLAAILVEEGKLKWNTRLFDVFPELEQRADPGWREETLSALLLNRGGLPPELNTDGLWDRLWKAKGPARDQRRMLLEGVIIHPPLSQPGTTFLYANANFALAGSMIEQVGGKPWEELITEKLFKPLGIESAGFGPPGTGSVLDQPRGHDTKGEPVGLTGIADNPESISPAGRVHMTITDWSKFAAFHLAGARAVRGLTQDTGTKLISKDSFDMLQTSPEGPDSGYAMGWGVTKRPWGGNVLVHSGSNNLWYSMLWISPEKDLALMACCNQGGDHGQKACDEAVGGMIQGLLGSLAGPGGAKPPTPLPAGSVPVPPK